MASVIRTRSLAALVVAAGVVLAGCGDEKESTEGLEVTTSQTPTFVPEKASGIQADALDDEVEDPGLHLAYTLQGTVSGQAGGSIITVKVKNLNDIPVPPDALDEPTLKAAGGANVDLLDAEDAGVAGMDGLDRPLGAGATTNLRYPFDIAPGNLSNARFTIGNVTFIGQL